MAALMRDRTSFSAAFWPVADQAVVSLGTFLINIILARQTTPSEYGIFAILISLIILLQSIGSSLVFYPLSVRGASNPENRKRLISVGAALVGLMTLPLGIGLAGITAFFIRSDLAVPVLVFFAAAQLQEAFRRGLLCEFRHRAALVGDTVSYIGQVLVAIVLAYHQALTPITALYSMAATSLLAAAIQAIQVSMERAGPRLIFETAKDFWSLGSWSLGSSLLGILRLQTLIWILAVISGTAATAGFQAAQNIINVANPLLISLSNIIPQAAARANAGGYRAALLSTRPYILFGLPPLLAFSCILIYMPETMLMIVYGSGSYYPQIAPAIQILAFSLVFNYMAVVSCAFLHGIGVVRSVLLIDASATAVAVTLSLILTVKLGLNGGCLALTIAQLIRAGAFLYNIIRLLPSDGSIQPKNVFLSTQRFGARSEPHHEPELEIGK
jgi:O-antigen/teichoic acid export membrane protein